MREIYVLRNGELVPKRLAPPKKSTVLLRDIPAYDCPVTGKMIDGRAAHRENLKRQGCRVLEPGETAQAQRDFARGRVPHDNDFSFLDRN